jgi:ABC-type polysaccharide/polyol phosphate export permease
MKYDSEETKYRNMYSDWRDTWMTIDLWIQRGFNDFKSRYHHTFLGVLWHTINPVIFSLVISLVFSSILDIEFIHYFIYVLLGYSVWLFANDILGAGSNIFVLQAGFILSQKTPLEGLIIQSLIQKMIILSINLSIAFLVAMLLGNKPLLNISTLLITLVLLFQAGLSGFAASLFLSTICAKFRDIPIFIGNCLRFLFFVTPIVWYPDMKAEGLRQTVTYLNPLYYATEMPRAIFLYPEIDAKPFLVISLLNVFLIIIAICVRWAFAKKINLWILP